MSIENDLNNKSKPILQPNEGLHKKLSQMMEDLSFDNKNKDKQPENTSFEVELTDDERKFLYAVERGDIATVKMMLDNQATLSINVNCADSLGRNALRIAIEYEHLELLEILLNHNLEIGDCLLHAISEEGVEAVEIILQAMAKRPKKKNLQGLLGNSSDIYTSDITPIILAAHKDNYSIIKILLDRGDTISKPHDLQCSCSECVTSHKEDSLRHSRSRINTYKALASPSLMCLSSKDPILTAFELSWELKRLGRMENEFKEDYEKLSLQCQQFATALVDQTRGSAELLTILNHDHGEINKTPIVPLKVNDDDEEETEMTLSRLKLAIKYKQKTFIAHPHCQQFLASLWYEGLPGIRRMSFINQSGLIGLICASFPILSAMYIFAPKSRMGSWLKKPFIKFLCRQSSFLFFLLLIAINSMKFEYIIFNNYQQRINDRGPPPSIIESCIIIYIAGYVWHEIKELYSNGLRSYLADMWNILDFGTNSLYVAIIGLRIAAYVNVYNSGNRIVYRGDWDSFEPVLISECLSAGANIISTLKLVNMFTISPILGPLQISLGRMLGDILNFFSLYILVIAAFAIGFHEVYWFYSNERSTVCQNTIYTYQTTGQELERYQYCTTRGRYFTNIFELVQALYWSVYGLIDVSNLNLEHKHVFTEFIGKLMFGIFCYITIIMLLNMFIAMMNNSYQIISEKSDMEWKFARSNLWVSYFEKGGSLPVPFNIIPSPKSIEYFFLIIKQLFCRCDKTHNKSKWKSIKKLVKKVNEKEAKHLLVVKDLIKRYLINRQRNGENKEITEDDLNEIKGDISSFRYELMEIYQMNGMKLPVYSSNRTAGRLRKKGSRKGFNKVFHKINRSLREKVQAYSKDVKVIVEEQNLPLKKKVTMFENQGFELEEDTSHLSDILLTSSLKIPNESNRRKSQISQLLDASGLLPDKNTKNKTEININISEDKDSKEQSDKNVEKKFDMV